MARRRRCGICSPFPPHPPYTRGCSPRTVAALGGGERDELRLVLSGAGEPAADEDLADTDTSRARADVKSEALLAAGESGG